MLIFIEVFWSSSKYQLKNMVNEFLKVMKSTLFLSRSIMLTIVQYIKLPLMIIRIHLRIYTFLKVRIGHMKVKSVLSQDLEARESTSTKETRFCAVLLQA